LKDLPEDHQARKDKDPENDRLDRRIHEEKPLFSQTPAEKNMEERFFPT
jgi:hypothetical protein